MPRFAIFEVGRNVENGLIGVDFDEGKNCIGKDNTH